MSWLRDLRENPVYRLEMLRTRRWRGLQGRKDVPARHPWRVWLFGWAICAATPYIAHPLSRWLDAWTGTSPQVGPSSESANLMALGAIVAMAAMSAGDMVLSAATCLAGERDRRTLAPLLLTCLTSAGILLGKGMAVALRPLAGISLCFLIWIAVPPLPAGADLGFMRLGQPPRELLGLLWMDAVAASVALTCLGLVVSAGCRSARAAGVLSAGLLVAAVVLALPVMGNLVVRRTMASLTALAQPVLNVPLSLHAGLWAGGAAVAITCFVIAQALLDAIPARVRLFPGGATWFRLSRRGAVFAAVLLALLTLAGAAGLGARSASLLAGYQAYWGTGGVSERLDRLVTHRRYQDAIALADAELQRDWPPEAAAFLWGSKALCHARLREYRQAVIAFDEERRLWPGTEISLLNLESVGRCFTEWGKRRQAAEAYGRAAAVVRQSLPVAAERDRLVDRLPRLGRQMALCGDREGARAAFKLAMREGGRETVLEARRDLLLLDADLHAAPRLDIYTEGASLIVAGFRTGTGVLPTGLQPGDRILRVDGRPVRDQVSLYQILAGYQPRQRVTLTAARAGKTLEVHTQLRRP